MIDNCGELLNIRTAVAESRTDLESITEDYIIEVIIKSKCQCNMYDHHYASTAWCPGRVLPMMASVLCSAV